MHAINIDRVEGHIYATLSEQFFPIVGKLSYEIARNLGHTHPPERTIFWTIKGERLVLQRNQ